MKTKVIHFIVYLIIVQTFGRKDTANDQDIEHPKFFGIQTTGFYHEKETVEVFAKVQNCPIWKSTVSDEYVSINSQWRQSPYYLYQNKTTGQWHVDYPNTVNEDNCEVNDDHILYREVVQSEDLIVYQPGLHHPENSTLPKEEAWIDNDEPSRNVKIFAFIINKISGFSQSISGYEVYHHANVKEEKTYRAATTDECVEIAKENIKKCDYYFFSVKNLYTILDGRIVLDGMLKYFQ